MVQDRRISWSNSVVSDVLFDLIRAEGYHVGTIGFVRLCDGENVYQVSATDAKSGESWTVNAESEYQAFAELAQQLGFDLEDG